jgi:hypothetical protein
LGQIKSDNINRLIQLTDGYFYPKQNEIRNKFKQKFKLWRILFFAIRYKANTNSSLNINIREKYRIFQTELFVCLHLERRKTNHDKYFTKHYIKNLLLFCFSHRIWKNPFAINWAWRHLKEKLPVIKKTKLSIWSKLLSVFDKHRRILFFGPCFWPRANTKQVLVFVP